MIKLSNEKVLMLHKLMVEETGGSAELRDINLLDSALNSAYATFDGKDLVHTIEEKAAKIGYALISNHAFVDGNKRIGMYIMLIFLEVNGIELEITDADIIQMGLGVASGALGYGELIRWIFSHKR